MSPWLKSFGFFSLFTVCSSLIAIFFSINNFYLPGPLKTERTIVIPSGQSLDKISQQLLKENIISQAWLFTLHVRLRGEGSHLKAGEYLFSAHVTPQEILSKMRKGECVVHQVTIPEGMTTYEIIRMLNLNTDLKHEITVELQEGKLLPETYYYSLHDDRNALVLRMQEAMTKTLQAFWTRRSKEFPLKSAQEVLILASIVEKETALPQERSRIAGVFINRLRKGMPLQSDPTVAYGCFYLNHKPLRTLTYADLQTPHPYNTYLNTGLPPTPICNPGREAIQAVLHPLKTDELYFVADGTGGHVFSKTYEEHKKHHQQWRVIVKRRKQLLP